MATPPVSLPMAWAHVAQTNAQRTTPCRPSRPPEPERCLEELMDTCHTLTNILYVVLEALETVEDSALISGVRTLLTQVHHQSERLQEHLDFYLIAQHQAQRTPRP
jgi:hypothetical protein